MNDWVPITYRGYWDVPRIILFEHQGRHLLLECAFSEALDDYPDDYRVYLMPSNLREEDLPADWTKLSDMAICELTSVPVKAVQFDPTRRKQVNAAALVGLLAPEPARTE